MQSANHHLSAIAAIHTARGSHDQRHQTFGGYQDIVYLTVFVAADSMTTWMASYQVTAMQLHFGATPDSGHCRTILMGQQLFGDKIRWITDDSCTAQAVKQEHDGFIYLVWLRQVPYKDDDV